MLNIKDIIDDLPVVKGRRWSKRKPEQIDTIVIHHAAAYAEPNTLEQLKAFSFYHQRAGHLSKNGAPKIAYHYAIDKDGTAWKCNALSDVTWHAKGANTSSVGILLLGNFELTAPTVAQLEAGHELVKILRRDLPNCWKVLGHREVKGSSTACPGKNFTKEMLDELRDAR